MTARPEDERFYYVSRAEDCGYVLGDPERLSSRPNPGLARLISRAFTARRIRPLEPKIVEGRRGSQRLLVQCDGFSLANPTEDFRDTVLFRGLKEPRIRTGHWSRS